MLRLALGLALLAPLAAEPLLLSIDALTRPIPPGRPFAVRGVVTLARERILYLQDQTGALTVYPAQPINLALGDEVEVQGDLRAGSFSPVLDHASVRRLWSGSPPVPLALRPEQAAEGSYGSRLIDSEGRLLRKSLAGRYLRLTLESAGQIFGASLELSSPVAGSSPLLRRLEEGATLRVVGICAPSSGEEASMGNAFVILLRSPDDIREVQPAPWWNVEHTLWAGLAGLLTLAVISRLRHRALNLRYQAIVEERSRIAREMHDTLAQGFAGLTYQLEGMAREMHDAPPGPATRRLEAALQLVRHCREEAHRSIFALRSLNQNHPDLLALLLSSCDALRSSANVEIRTHRQGVALALPDETLNHLLRIGQEALSNALRHAQASQIDLTLAFEPQSVTLQVHDNGRGFVPEQARSAEHGHFGLLGMRERARHLHASFALESEPGRGTRVAVHVPLAKPPAWYRTVFQPKGAPQ